MSQQPPSQTVPVAGPIDSPAFKESAMVALGTVLRVACPATDKGGTAFLHKGGIFLTAEHVVAGCSDPLLVMADGNLVYSDVVGSDTHIDVAILKPRTPVQGRALELSKLDDWHLGSQLSIWGFPGGYNGSRPMLSVGYVSGVHSDNGSRRLVVNAAFNSGNSGGPVVDVQTGEVIGIVSSKLAPISDRAKSALLALQNQSYGMSYTETRPDGSQFTLFEGQIVAMVLDELRNQVQLVIGMATPADLIGSFLLSKGIAP